MTVAQVETLPPTDQGPGKNDAPPRDDETPPANVSSSRATRIDLSPPADDAKNHPNSGPEIKSPEDENDVQEMHPWDPHKAAKDVEVGDFYFRRKNYRAAIERYREALLFKPDDALANFRLGESLEKTNQVDESLQHYQAYLKILPHGPLSKEAEKAVEKLKSEKSQSAQSTSKP